MISCFTSVASNSFKYNTDLDKRPETECLMAVGFFVDKNISIHGES
jgi:hypothetical protein